MSNHRLAQRLRLRRRNRLTDPRRRVAAVATAAVALLVIAALIGGSGSSTRDSAAPVADRSGSSSGSTESTEQSTSDVGAPETTVQAEDSTAIASDDDAASEASGEGGADQPSFGTGQVPGAPADAKIIRTGDLTVQVGEGDFDATTTRLTTIATNAGGFIASSETSALDDRPRGSLTLRVPADRFDDVVGQVGKVGDVTAVTTSSQDVTGEYTDVESRLKALVAEREQINLVLARAESIPDILSVRDRLSFVQGEIETLQGRQQVLDDQTSLSTLTVSLSEAGDPEVVTAPAERSGFATFRSDLGDRFTDGGRAIAFGLASMAPWLLLGLVLFVPARILWRRSTPPPAPAAE